MCLYPKIIRNRRYTATKKNGGVIPPVIDKRTEYVPIGCGKCMECMKQKSRSWYIRLNEEIKRSKNGVFVTLTFSDESIKNITEGKNIKGEQIREPITAAGYQLDNEIATQAVRDFLERWRKKYKVSVKHWLVTEIGGHNTENIHLHGIIFTDNKKDIENIWQYGYVYLGEYISEKTVSYITKYITKVDIKHKNYQQKILTSAGIGRNYIESHNATLNKFRGKETREQYVNKQGFKMNLPIYYRNHIYSEDEKQKLWIQLLDKNKRYVCGQEIDITNGDEEYYNTLKYYQKINKRLGYGSNETDWSQKAYENQKRNLKVRQRVKNCILQTGAEGSLCTSPQAEKADDKIIHELDNIILVPNNKWQ